MLGGVQSRRPVAVAFIQVLDPVIRALRHPRVVRHASWTTHNVPRWLPRDLGAEASDSD